MPFVKGKPNPSKGRKAGTPNKLTQEVKAVIIEVATGLGGAAGMLKWTKQDPKNEASFWTSIYPRIAPLEHSGGIEVKTPAIVQLPPKDARV